MYCSLNSQTNNAHYYISEKNDIHVLVHDDHNFAKVKNIPFNVVSYNKLCFHPSSDRVNYNYLLPNCENFNNDSNIKCNNTTKHYNYHPLNGELWTSCNSSEKTEECSEQTTTKPNKLQIDYIPQNNLHFDANNISSN